MPIVPATSSISECMAAKKHTFSRVLSKKIMITVCCFLFHQHFPAIPVRASPQMSRQVIISDPRNEIHTPFMPNNFANRTAQTTIPTIPATLCNSYFKNFLTFPDCPFRKNLFCLHHKFPRIQHRNPSVMPDHCRFSSLCPARVTASDPSPTCTCGNE